MFEIGEYIVYGSKGVCRVEDITHMNMTGADSERLYYVLVRLDDEKGRIYVPVDNQKVVMRKVITPKAAEALIRKMPRIDLLWVKDEKQREERYKEAIRTCDYEEWVSIIKTLYCRQKERMARGKKITALDEKYLKAAEDGLYSELSLTLGIPKNEMEDYIKTQLQV